MDQFTLGVVIGVVATIIVGIFFYSLTTNDLKRTKNELKKQNEKLSNHIDILLNFLSHVQDEDVEYKIWKDNDGVWHMDVKVNLKSSANFTFTTKADLTTTNETSES